MGFDQPGLIEGVHAHGRGIGTKVSFEDPSNPNHSMILRSYDHISISARNDSAESTQDPICFSFLRSALLSLVQLVVHQD